MSSGYSSSGIARYQCFVLAICAVGLSVDLIEVSLGSVLSTVLSAPPNAINNEKLAILLAAVYAGAIVGAPLIGRLADVYGRRAMLIVIAMIMAATSFASGLSEGIGRLTILRGISGLALGAYPPLMFAYLSEVLPPARRGRMVMIVLAFANLGPPAMLFAVGWLTPLSPLGLSGWRWGFIFGGIAAATCAVMFCLIPESPQWLLHKSKLEREGQSVRLGTTVCLHTPQRLAVRPPVMPTPPPNWEHRRRLTFVVVALFLPAWAVFGFPLLSGPTLIRRGVNVSDSLLYVGAASIAPVIGAIIGGFIVDLFERRSTLIASATAMAIFGMVFSVVHSPFWLVVSAIAFGLASSFLLPVLVLYAAELFAAERRAGAVSWAWASSRVSSALMPIALIPILLGHGPVITFSVTSGMLLVFVLFLLVFGPPGETGRPIP